MTGNDNSIIHVTHVKIYAIQNTQSKLLD